ncbi:MAG TPA: pantoate--beta-alanine ligase [Usitatibacter sp.]|nr:pantoate--beta-alanine ligase [Usitatibacter sp.]
MELIHTVAELRARLARERSVVLVPTMGNLHAGHMALVEKARDHGSCVAVSVFVNRLQFEPGGDFDRYPRTLEADCEKLARARCDVVFAPDEREMYPGPQEIVLSPPRVSLTLEGEYRAGHFQGVVTVVAKLLNIVMPHAAIFGKKDYQQLLVLRELVRQLNFGVKVVPGETVRESDGLAMSSRNGYLSAEERREAVRLSRVLRAVHDAIAGGRRDFPDLEKAAKEELAAHGWRPDYIAIRRRADLAPPGADDHELVTLGAAWLGRTRLIDNLEI